MITNMFEKSIERCSTDVMIQGDIQILLFHVEEDLPPDHLHRATCSKGRTHCRLVLLFHFASIMWLLLCYNLSIECPVFFEYSETARIYGCIQLKHFSFNKF